MPTDAVSRADDAPTSELAAADAPTTELVATSAGDRCSNCHAPLATDQRYCVACGERRGKARFSASDMAPAHAPASGAPAGAVAAAQPAPAPPARRSWASAGAAYAAGVATLLIAMGVGVLIGHNSAKSPAAGNTSPIHITVGGGGYAAGPATSANTTASTPTGTHKKSKPVVVHVNAKVQKAAQQAASKVLGSGGNLSSNVTQQQGAKCSTGAGCQGGQFTGNFFGQ